MIACAITLAGSGAWQIQQHAGTFQLLCLHGELRAILGCRWTLDPPLEIGLV
jgi:hypothetical protein